MRENLRLKGKECGTVNIKTYKRKTQGKTMRTDERFGENKARQGGKARCIRVVFCLLCMQCARNVHMCSCKTQFRHCEAHRHAIRPLHLKLTFQLIPQNVSKQHENIISLLIFPPWNPSTQCPLAFVSSPGLSFITMLSRFIADLLG